MANLFRQVGIYPSVGQLYEPEDANSMLYYRESKEGQLLEEGITEAGEDPVLVGRGRDFL